MFQHHMMKPDIDSEVVKMVSQKHYHESGGDAFIIPDEIPTLLSVIYSNIPPVKLGFDTRFGFGFRLGPHADFQTLIEIGPQENTRPIGMNDTVSKRQSLTRTQAKLLSVMKKPEAEETVKDNETIEPSLSSILFGRNGKKSVKPQFDEIEFKKVPGIDDVKWTTKSKSAKLKADKSPTKIVIFR